MTTLKRGDTGPLVLRANADLSAATVKLLGRRRPDGVATPEELAELIEVAPTSKVFDGEVTLVTVPAELVTANIGRFRFELEAEQGGFTQTFPSAGYLEVTIEPDLG